MKRINIAKRTLAYSIGLTALVGSMVYTPTQVEAAQTQTGSVAKLKKV
ncbi:hypothetical protein [Bacillus wiedmannii]